MFAVVAVGVAVWLDGREGQRMTREANEEIDRQFEEAERFLRERAQAKSEERLRFERAEEQRRQLGLESFEELTGKPDPFHSRTKGDKVNPPSTASKSVSDWKAGRDERYAAAEARGEAYIEEEKAFNSKLRELDVPPPKSFESIHEAENYLAAIRRKIDNLEAYKAELSDAYSTEQTTEQSRRMLRLSQRKGELRRRLDEADREALDWKFDYWLDTCVTLQGVFAERIRLSQETELQVWLNTRQRPSPQPYGVSHEGAEHLVAEWLSYLGETNVEVTQFVGDGGVDVESDHVVCQVKNYGQGGVSSGEMRDLFGTATAAGKLAILFTSSRLTQDALEFAQSNDIACVFYDASKALLQPLTEAGDRFLSQGHYEH